MPQVFKALASISAWVLFVMGCKGVLVPNVFVVLSGTVGVEEPSLGYYVAQATGVACLILAVVAMKLRQMLE